MKRLRDRPDRERVCARAGGENGEREGQRERERETEEERRKTGEKTAGRRSSRYAMWIQPVPQFSPIERASALARGLPRFWVATEILPRIPPFISENATRGIARE